jgi:anthranilate phosphoribosyltransferase
MVVFGQDTMDEITPSAKTSVCEIRDGKTKSYEINPEDYGITICSKSDLEGGDGLENAQITKDILSGKITGPKKDAVLLNAGACIYINRDDITYKEAIDIARETIESGKAYDKLNEYVEATQN